MGTLPASFVERFAYHYSTPPSLAAFKVLELNGMDHGPSIQLCGSIAEKPDLRPSFREGEPFVEAIFIFDFFKIRDFAMVGVPRGTGALSVEERDNIHFEFRSDRLRIQGAALEATLGIQIRTKTPTTEQRRISVFSYPNVWNSCLLLGASKGFSFRLIGKPDNEGFASCVTWEATKDGVRLKGDTPIELAGLISLYEYHQPTKGKDYWWRIEGDDLLGKVRREWQTRYFGPGGKDEPKE